MNIVVQNKRSAIAYQFLKKNPGTTYSLNSALTGLYLSFFLNLQGGKLMPEKLAQNERFLFVI